MRALGKQEAARKILIELPLINQSTDPDSAFSTSYSRAKLTVVLRSFLLRRQSDLFLVCFHYFALWKPDSTIAQRGRLAVICESHF